MSKIAGFCVVDTNYKKQLLVTIQSLYRHLKSKIDFFVYNKQINKNVIHTTNMDVPEIDFEFRSNTIYDKFMPLLLAKLKILSDLSQNYDQVFFIDLDILFFKYIDELFEKYSEPYLYGCLEDTNKLRLYERRIKVLDFIGITEHEYINAGFLILNFKYDFDLEELKRFFELCPYSNCPEQDFLNWKFKDKIKVMPNSVCWNKFLPFETSPYMVHFLGFPKPWDIGKKSTRDIYGNYYDKCKDNS